MIYILITILQYFVFASMYVFFSSYNKGVMYFFLSVIYVGILNLRIRKNKIIHAIQKQK